MAQRAQVGTLRLLVRRYEEARAMLSTVDDCEVVQGTCVVWLQFRRSGVLALGASKITLI
jgi:hypothetical protein